MSSRKTRISSEYKINYPTPVVDSYQCLYK